MYTFLPLNLNFEKINITLKEYVAATNAFTPLLYGQAKSKKANSGKKSTKQSETENVVAAGRKSRRESETKNVRATVFLNFYKTSSSF